MVLYCFLSKFKLAKRTRLLAYFSLVVNQYTLTQFVIAYHHYALSFALFSTQAIHLFLNTKKFNFIVHVSVCVEFLCIQEHVNGLRSFHARTHSLTVCLDFLTFMFRIMFFLSLFG